MQASRVTSEPPPAVTEGRPGESYDPRGGSAPPLHDPISERTGRQPSAPPSDASGGPSAPPSDAAGSAAERSRLIAVIRHGLFVPESLPSPSRSGASSSRSDVHPGGSPLPSGDASSWSATADSLARNLLARILSGEIRVSDLEKVLCEALDGGSTGHIVADDEDDDGMRSRRLSLLARCAMTFMREYVGAACQRERLGSLQPQAGACCCLSEDGGVASAGTCHRRLAAAGVGYSPGLAAAGVGYSPGAFRGTSDGHPPGRGHLREGGAGTTGAKLSGSGSGSDGPTGEAVTSGAYIPRRRSVWERVNGPGAALSLSSSPLPPLALLPSRLLSHARGAGGLELMQELRVALQEATLAPIGLGRRNGR